MATYLPERAEEAKLGPSPQDEQLFDAIETEDTLEVMRLIEESKVDLTSSDLLAKATKTSDSNIFMVLFAAKASATIPAEGRNIAKNIHHSSWSAQEKRAALKLIDQWHPIALSPPEQRKKLSLAVEAQDLETVTSLIESKADVKKDDLLAKATKARDKDIFIALFAAKASVTVSCYDNDLAESIALSSWPSPQKISTLALIKRQQPIPPLFEAAIRGDVMTVAKEMTGEHVSESKSSTKNRRSVLHYACASGQIKVIDYLLKNFPTLKGRADQRGYTEIDYAAFNGKVDVIEFLRKDHNYSLDPRLALIAAAGGQLKMFEFLIQTKTTSIDFHDTGSNTALHEAAHAGHKDVVVYLLKNGAHIGHNWSEKTPLDLALAAGHAEVTELLAYAYQQRLTYFSGNKIERRDWLLNFVNSQLPSAVMTANIEMIESLFKIRAEVSSVRYGYPSLEESAAAHNHTAILQLLIEKRRDISLSEGSALLSAAASGSIEAAELLLKYDYDTITETGRSTAWGFKETPLHSAARNNKISMVRWLISNKADINGKDELGRDALAAMIDFSPTKTLMINLLLELKATPSENFHRFRNSVFLSGFFSDKPEKTLSIVQNRPLWDQNLRGLLAQYAGEKPRKLFEDPPSDDETSLPLHGRASRQDSHDSGRPTEEATEHPLDMDEEIGHSGSVRLSRSG